VRPLAIDGAHICPPCCATIWHVIYHAVTLDASAYYVIALFSMDDIEDRNLVQLATFVPPVLADQVKTAADKDERSVSSWIRRVLARELEQSAA